MDQIERLSEGGNQSVTPNRAFRKARPRHGKIALVGMVFLLLMVVLLGLIGNAGHTVNQKLESQNAADAIAFSSTMWLARGMNTITASNHLVGEATAISVMHESLGGAELRLGLENRTTENDTVDAVLRGLRVTSPIGRIPNPYVPISITELDRRIIEFVTNRTSPPTPQPLTAFATIYDSQLTLKRTLAGWLTAKSVANLAFIIPPPFGYIPAIAAYVVHIAATVNVVLIGKEWLLLEVLEKYARVAAPIQNKTIDRQLIPTLCEFAANTAGLSLEAANGESETDQPGYAAKAAIDSAETLANAHQVKGAFYPSEKLKLPVVFEPKPDMNGRSGDWPTAWGDDRQGSFPAIENAGQVFDSKLDDALGDIANRLIALTDAVGKLEDLEDDIQEEIASVGDERQAEFKEEIETLNTLIASLETEHDELSSRAREVVDERASLENALTSIIDGESENLSLNHLPAEMNPDQERRSQWVRATVPNLDGMRAPVLSLMKSLLPISQAAKHYEKWTNRYTLIYAWKFRSGQRLEKTGTASATWNESVNPLGMLVLVDTFSDDLPVKGKEPWSGTDRDQQELAEELFTYVAASHRPFEPIFSSVIFPAPNEHGITSITQSILYNANRQQQVTGSSDRQPVVGWDTLNWDHDSQSVPEWGRAAAVGDQKWPWELFDSRQSRSLVKLNWQPKLIPVTESRLRLALPESDEEFEEVLQFAIDYSKLLTH